AWAWKRLANRSPLTNVIGMGLPSTVASSLAEWSGKFPGDYHNRARACPGWLRRAVSLSSVFAAQLDHLLDASRATVTTCRPESAAPERASQGPCDVRSCSTRREMPPANRLCLEGNGDVLGSKETGRAMSFPKESGRIGEPSAGAVRLEDVRGRNAGQRQRKLGSWRTK